MLLNEKGESRASLAVRKGGSALGLRGKNGKSQAGLSVLDRPLLVLFDWKGKTRAALGVTESGPGLRLYDEKGKCRAVLSALKHGPGLSLYDEKGKVLWSAP